MCFFLVLITDDLKSILSLINICYYSFQNHIFIIFKKPKKPTIFTFVLYICKTCNMQRVGFKENWVLEE
jgi:hypothetical protein